MKSLHVNKATFQRVRLSMIMQESIPFFLGCIRCSINGLLSEGQTITGENFISPCELLKQRVLKRKLVLEKGTPLQDNELSNKRIINSAKIKDVDFDLLINLLHHDDQEQWMILFPTLRKKNRRWGIFYRRRFDESYRWSLFWNNREF